MEDKLRLEGVEEMGVASKPIFPKNWEKKKRKLQFWKKPEIQENICPKCHCYTQRFKRDGGCQFCGYDVNPKLQPKPIDIDVFVEIKTNEMEQMMMPKNSRREDREHFIRSIIKEFQRPKV